jgi:alpha-tubulin suppressor-like RCC1 family protein
MAAACADDGTVFVVENGAVYACGRGQYGQLGLNSREHQRQPARVGAIWTCDHGADGQGDAQHRLQPTRLGPEAFGGSPGVLVACGLYQVGEERAKLARR